MLLNSHYDEWANSSPPTHQIATDCEQESTASHLGLENAFHHSIYHTFLLCHTCASITTSLSPGCGWPWIRGRLRPHLSLRVNELAPPPPKFIARLTEEKKRFLLEQQRSAIPMGQSSTSPKSMLHLHIRKSCSDCHSTHQDTYSTTTSPHRPLPWNVPLMTNRGP